MYPELYIDRSIEISAKRAWQFLVWYKKQLNPFLSAYFAEKIREAAEIHPETTALVEEVRRFVQNGGKRVRPAFTYAAYIACGGRAHEAILYASAAVEVVHAFALIHDDIIDSSPLRRGHPSAHKVFEDFHKKRGFTGSSPFFGISAAILAGDLALSFADELLNTSPFPSERIRKAKNYFDINKKQVILGEYLDVIASCKKQVTEADVLKILEYKTAKYTVERPLHIGAALAGASEDVYKTLSEYGIPLGQAFQIQDDILGTFGREEELGKPTDSDIKEGKRTILIVKAYEFCNLSERKILDHVLGNKKATSSQIESVRLIIKRSGAFDYSNDFANKLLLQAKRSIENANLTKDGKGYLLQAADYLIERSATLNR